MNATVSNKQDTGVIGASLFVPDAGAEDLYEVLLDVRGFPRWAPGVRRVEIVGGPRYAPGMVSEWEVSALGARRKVRSVLLRTEPPELLRWTYEGAACGWGECRMRDDLRDGVLAGFRTQLRPAEPVLEGLFRASLARSAATHHLKRCLARLGRTVSGNGTEVRVGPLRAA